MHHHQQKQYIKRIMLHPPTGTEKCPREGHGTLTKLGPYPAFRDRLGNKTHLFCADPLRWNPELHLTTREPLSYFPFYIFVKMLSHYISVSFLGKSFCEFRFSSQLVWSLFLNPSFQPIIPSYALLAEHKFSFSSATFQPLPYGLRHTTLPHFYS